MTRDDAERLAALFNEAVWTTDDHGLQPGIKMAAILVAEHVEAEGKMGARTFLRQAGVLAEPEMPARFANGNAAPRKRGGRGANVR